MGILGCRRFKFLTVSRPLREKAIAWSPPSLKLRLTWEKKEGRKLTDEEFKKQKRIAVLLRPPKPARGVLSLKAGRWCSLHLFYDRLFSVRKVPYEFCPRSNRIVQFLTYFHHLLTLHLLTLG